MNKITSFNYHYSVHRAGCGLDARQTLVQFSPRLRGLNLVLTVQIVSGADSAFYSVGTKKNFPGIKSAEA
jgi:hypothetical protein